MSIPLLTYSTNVEILTSPLTVVRVAVEWVSAVVYRQSEHQLHARGCSRLDHFIKSGNVNTSDVYRGTGSEIGRLPLLEHDNKLCHFQVIARALLPDYLQDITV